jgi:hypothetical protein
LVVLRALPLSVAGLGHDATNRPHQPDVWFSSLVSQPCSEAVTRDNAERSLDRPHAR